jgi:hypothetical protein
MHPVHVSTVDRPFKTKGYVIRAVHARSKGPGCRKRRAAAMSPESGGARQGLAGVGPGRRSRPPFRPRAAAKRSGGACACDRGSMGAILPRRRPAPEGGGAAASASLWVRCCARKEGKTGEKNCSQFKGVAGELEDEEDATAAELGNGGGSGGAPVWSRRGSHGLWGRGPAANQA